MVIDQIIEKDYALYLGDCIETMQKLPKEFMHLSIYSPPFAHKGGGLYHYSSDNRDLSNCDSYEQFFDHYEYVVNEIFRTTLLGRMSAVHCTDIATGNTGKDSYIDFPGDIIRLHQKIGFDYVGRYCIWKEPLGVRNRLQVKNLMHCTVVDDSSRCSNAAADYLLMFRKKGENPIPISHPNGLLYYAGERQIPKELIKYRGYQGDQTENKYSHWIWRQYASSFWDDIRIDNILPFKKARDEEDEKHVHPLQLDVIDRCLILWTNPKEIVGTPFMGVGSEPYGAVSFGRKAWGVELKESYFKQSVKNMKSVKTRFNGERQIDLFEENNLNEIL